MTTITELSGTIDIPFVLFEKMDSFMKECHTQYDQFNLSIDEHRSLYDNKLSILEHRIRGEGMSTLTRSKEISELNEQLNKLVLKQQQTVSKYEEQSKLLKDKNSIVTQHMMQENAQLKERIRALSDEKASLSKTMGEAHLVLKGCTDRLQELESYITMTKEIRTNCINAERQVADFGKKLSLISATRQQLDPIASDQTKCDSESPAESVIIGQSSQFDALQSTKQRNTSIQEELERENALQWVLVSTLERQHATNKKRSAELSAAQLIQSNLSDSVRRVEERNASLLEELEVEHGINEKRSAELAEAKSCAEERNTNIQEDLEGANALRWVLISTLKRQNASNEKRSAELSAARLIHSNLSNSVRCVEERNTSLLEELEVEHGINEKRFAELAEAKSCAEERNTNIQEDLEGANALRWVLISTLKRQNASNEKRSAELSAARLIHSNLSDSVRCVEEGNTSLLEELEVEHGINEKRFAELAEAKSCAEERNTNIQEDLEGANALRWVLISTLKRQNASNEKRSAELSAAQLIHSSLSDSVRRVEERNTSLLEELEVEHGINEKRSAEMALAAAKPYPSKLNDRVRTNKKPAVAKSHQSKLDDRVRHPEKRNKSTQDELEEGVHRLAGTKLLHGALALLWFICILSTGYTILEDDHEVRVDIPPAQVVVQNDDDVHDGYYHPWSLGDGYIVEDLIPTS